jgi:hypothetical protein
MNRIPAAILACFLSHHGMAAQDWSVNDYSCSASRTTWMNILRDNGIKGVSLEVKFASNQHIVDVHLERVRYFSDYNQTNSTEIRDQDKIGSLRLSTLGDQLYEYALPQIEQIIRQGAESTNLQRSYGSFTYSVYDDPCRKTVYFSPKFVDPDETELMRVAEAHDLERVRKLLADVGKVNLQDQYGRTALLHATASPHSAAMVAALLSAGADVNIPDSRGTTALMNASQLGEVDTAKMLLAHRADANNRTDTGVTALMLAADAGRSGGAIVQLLVNSGASVNDQDIDGKTALMVAVREPNVESVQNLLQAGASTKIMDSHGKTAIEYAHHPDVKGGTQQDAIIRMLLNASSPK